MQTEQELIKNINKITLAIEQNYPELIDFFE
jgi:hypothetical protein